ncbi:MAG: hypothetical protein QM689_11925 [Oscillospiraceae bacterium]
MRKKYYLLSGIALAVVGICKLVGTLTENAYVYIAASVLMIVSGLVMIFFLAKARRGNR